MSKEMIDSLKRNWLFSLFCVICTVICLLLGVWQVQRLTWKENLISSITKAQKAPAVSLAQNIDNAHNMYHRKVSLSGTFPSTEEILLTSKMYKGEYGYYVIAPFRLDNGETILVNRGWISLDEKNSDTRRKAIKQFYGVIKPSAKKPAFFVVQNEPTRNLWFWPIVPEMIKYFQRTVNSPISPILVQIIPNEHAELQKEIIPTPVPYQVHFRNDHKQYAITWFLLSITIMVMLGFYLNSKRKITDE